MTHEGTMLRFSQGAPKGLNGQCTSLAIATNNGFVDFPHIVSTSANGFCLGESLENAQNLGHFVRAETPGTCMDVHLRMEPTCLSIQMTQ